MVTEHAKQAIKKILRPAQVSDSSAQSGGEVNVNLSQKYAQLNERLAAFKASASGEVMLEGQANAVGLKVHQDEQHPRDVLVTSSAGEIVRLDAAKNLASRWTALHLELGALDLSAIDTIGVLIKSRSHLSATTTQVCLRSGTHNKFRDCFLSHHMVSTPIEGRHFDVHQVGTDTQLPRVADWHELVLFFRSDHDLDLSITDLRLFAL